jgi:hypothetical protein
MANEIVTQSSRFFCVSMAPDLCKTPAIPYVIKGEFSQATGVSRNIKSNGALVVISASTTIKLTSLAAAGPNQVSEAKK